MKWEQYNSYATMLRILVEKTKKKTCLRYFLRELFDELNIAVLPNSQFLRIDVLRWKIHSHHLMERIAADFDWDQLIHLCYDMEFDLGFVMWIEDPS
jgi:hypothetical protein